jgi:hypothetical protein
MPTQIGENRASKMLKANELVLCMGVNQLRTPNIAMIAAARRATIYHARGNSWLGQDLPELRNLILWIL